MANDTKRIQEETNAGLRRISAAVLQKSWLVALVAVACAVLVFLGTFFFITPKYEASVKIYVNNSSISLGDTSVSISSGDLTTSRNLVDTYIVILETRETLNDVIDYASANLTYGTLKGMISASAVDDTEIFQVTVTSTDPQEAERLANAVAYILPKRITTIIDGTSAKVVESAVVPTNASSPSYVLNTMLGFLIGLVLAVAVVAIRELTDTTIRTEEDITQICNHPVLASIPDMAAAGKGGYYAYGKYGKYSQDKDGAKTAGKEPVLVGPNISFAASEAYKLLRTKLQFSFAGEGGSRVIGVSSAISGEGKSLSSVNLACSMAELGKKVILIDCDMRRPTLAEKLKLQKTPGISSYLTGQSDLMSLRQPCGIEGMEDSFQVITAGHNPPNPSELLSSQRMRDALELLRQEYDYVILDMPPVSEVSDAMTVTADTDGTLLVVRENYCDRYILADTVRQFESINAKILGVLVNCASENGGKGYYKKYYKKYHHRYGKYYGRSPYQDAGRRGDETESRDR